jgi:hypothetical protein
VLVEKAWIRFAWFSDPMAGLRELVISYGKSGYIALYSYESSDDVALILAIRHQREAGFEEIP